MMFVLVGYTRLVSAPLKVAGNVCKVYLENHLVTLSPTFSAPYLF